MEIPIMLELSKSIKEIKQDSCIKITPKNKKVFVAMSGGVDSSVAAALLKERGYDIIGVFMQGWPHPMATCSWKTERRDAMAAAAVLDIPFLTFDFSNEYYESVVKYTLNEYAAGRTPNPDVMCNKYIKFGFFLKKALELEADYIATGHYVRMDQNLKLSIAKDKNKDQSYFLWTLKQEQLKYCIFPIGDYEKSEVRKLAHKYKLPTADKKDSQGVCFIGQLDMADFLREFIPKKKGNIVTSSGKKVGGHDGLYFYTIGQRHGMDIGGGGPYFIADKNFDTNTLIVAENENDPILFKKELQFTDANWLHAVEFPFECEARIRYRQPLQKCRVEKNKVVFEEPQRAIAPGQSVVFYRRNELLGGGIIS
ncbi:tRNA 2-thiouridine(34) synthase MnmA [Patescibacteria group bacterium]